MRLQQYMARSGVASRRKSEEYIAMGRVKVNGNTINTPGFIVSKGDVVEVDGNIVSPVKDYTYLLLNKPSGVVTTVRDERGRRTVLSLVDTDARVYPVGRLDMDTTGLVFLTDDGDVAQKLMHPSEEVKKTYIVKVEGHLNKETLKSLEEGVWIPGGLSAPAKAKILKSSGKDTILSLTIHEGRNHQVKNMMKAVGHPVKRLKRISIGNLRLGDLPLGKYRTLTEEEIKYIRSL